MTMKMLGMFNLFGNRGGAVYLKHLSHDGIEPFRSVMHDYYVIVTDRTRK